jgi:hypothetical protein
VTTLNFSKLVYPSEGGGLMVMMSPTLGTTSPGRTSALAGAILFSSGRLEPGTRYWKIIWVGMCYLLENALVRMLASLEALRRQPRRSETVLWINN